MPIFVRRYMSDRAHRLLTADTTYCGRKALLGERLRRVSKLGRCEPCEDRYEVEQRAVRIQDRREQG